MTREIPPRLGFIGLGAMGGGMARNLLAAGYPVTAFDPDAARLAACVAAGATAATDNAAVVAAGRIVLLSLPSFETVDRIMMEEVFPYAQVDQTFINLGTTTVSASRRLAAAFAEQGATLLDAPVSGGSGGAAAGALHIFVGGARDQALACWPILEVLGDPARIVYCGPAGAGQIVKTVNQLAMGLVSGAYLEILSYGVKAGVDPAAIGQAVGGDSGWRAHFARHAERIAAGQGAEIEAKLGQLPYFLAEAAAAGIELPMAEALAAFVKEGEPVTIADGRPVPSYWRELIGDTEGRE